MYKIAAVGDFDETAYFGVIGAETFFPKSRKDAKGILERLMKENYAIIFVSDRYLMGIDNTKAALPAIVALPDKSGENTGEKALREYIKRAAGSDINA